MQTGSDKALKGTIVYQKLHVFDGGSLEITLEVPLKRSLMKSCLI